MGGRIDNLEGNYLKKILGYLAIGLLGGGVAAALTFAFIESAPTPVPRPTTLNNIPYLCDPTQLKKLVTQKTEKPESDIKAVLDPTQPSENKKNIFLCLRDLAIFNMPKGKRKEKCDFRSIYQRARSLEYDNLLSEIKIALDPNCASTE